MGKRLKSDLKRAIQEEGGNISRVAGRFGVTRQTIYSDISRWDLWAEVQTYRRMMFAMAEDNLLGALEAGDTDISKFVVTHMPGGERWSSRQEIDLGAVRLSDDVLALLDTLGIEAETVAAEFERIVREQAALLNDRA